MACALGIGLDAYRTGIADNRCGVGPIRGFSDPGVAAQLPLDHLGPDELSDVTSPDLLARLDQDGSLRDRKVGLALLAAREALEPLTAEERRESWLHLGLGLEVAFLGDFDGVYENGRFDWSAAPDRASAFRTDIDVAARAVCDNESLGGPITVDVSACAAGGLSLARAASLIERGLATRVICGGADAMVNPLGYAGMQRLGATSPRAELDACRPFDRRRDGLVMGEGAAVFVVESEATARAAGRTPLAAITGWGSTQDAWRATAPRPDGAGAAEAMRRALSRAGLTPEQIGWINAHGTGTPLNDPAEIAAIRRALPDCDVPISSIKGAVGHTMAAAGAVEAVACILAFTDDLLAGTTHLTDPDPACEANLPRQATHRRVDHVLSNSFGFGGQNVCLALSRVAPR